MRWCRLNAKLFALCIRVLVITELVVSGTQCNFIFYDLNCPPQFYFFLIVYQHFTFHTSGDPRQDLEYERQLHQQTYIVPEPIKNFLNYFQKVVAEQNTYEIGMAYENG